ncbi:HAMP domain-containing sensor histidine kinase [Rhodoferax saidenbachensis]|uniref:histidine kinase n=1 Tax=Rhodoferax saidenbachensis TaxID=1484693 RepID=A0ABU1ZJI1_9BURK|nr:HAMP domain-containing sensor histidine kinase [Rhodoferax saidenbachensis]MDR7305096.1 signal transduction histidine kinase [Rhodoferax saidenbachensis]
MSPNAAPSSHSMRVHIAVWCMALSAATAAAVLGLARLGLSWRDAEWWGLAMMALVLLGLLAWWGAGRSLTPLHRLAATVAARRPQETALLEHAPAAELEAIVRGLNSQWQQQQAALDQQQRFIAEASHQLRTPLAVLKTQLQGAIAGELLPVDTLPKMLRTVDRASHLANQLLSKAKVDQKLQNAQWTDIDLQHIASEVLVECAPLIARKRLDVSLEALPVRLHTDGWLVGELLRNLVANAIHQSRAGGSLGVVIRYLPTEVELLVWDNAGGIDEEVRERLFLPFESASGGTGVGLGLSICKQIAVSMQASLDLYNRLHNGTVVGVDAVVRWPLPEGQTPTTAPLPAAAPLAQPLSHATLRVPA